MPGRRVAPSRPAAGVDARAPTPYAASTPRAVSASTPRAVSASTPRALWAVSPPTPSAVAPRASSAVAPRAFSVAAPGPGGVRAPRPLVRSRLRRATLARRGWGRRPKRRRPTRLRVVLRRPPSCRTLACTIGPWRRRRLLRRVLRRGRRLPGGESPVLPGLARCRAPRRLRLRSALLVGRRGAVAVRSGPGVPLARRVRRAGSICAGRLLSGLARPEVVLVPCHGYRTSVSRSATTRPICSGSEPESGPSTRSARPGTS